MDFSDFSNDQLHELNDQIVKELQRRHAKSQREALINFEPGDDVEFKSPDGQELRKGKVIRVNKKSLTIETEKHGSWRVAPVFVSKLKSENDKAAKVLRLLN